jgi:hypothetical protein
MPERAIFNGDNVELQTAKINLVFNKTHGESDYPDRLVIDSEVAMQHYDWMEEVSDVADSLFRAIVHDWQGPVTKAALEKSQPCYRRLAGMLDLTARAMIAGTPFVWKYPEDGLHPMYQGNVADVIIALSDPAGLKALLGRQQPPCGQV